TIDSDAKLLGYQLRLDSEQPLTKLAFAGVGRHAAVCGDRNPRVDLFAIHLDAVDLSAPHLSGNVRGSLCRCRIRSRLELPLQPCPAETDQEHARRLQEVPAGKSRARDGAPRIRSQPHPTLSWA